MSHMSLNHLLYSLQVSKEHVANTLVHMKQTWIFLLYLWNSVSLKNGENSAAAMYLTILLGSQKINLLNSQLAYLLMYLFIKIFFKKQLVIKLIAIYIRQDGLWHFEDFCSLSWLIFISEFHMDTFQFMLMFFQFSSINKYINLSMWSLAISSQNLTSNVVVLISALFTFTHLVACLRF